MIAIDVLGDDGHRCRCLELGKGSVGGVGLGGCDEATAPVVPTPDKFGIACEGCGGGQFLGPVPAPQAVLFTAEGWNTAGRGNTGSRQNRDPGFPGKAFLDPVKFRTDVCFHGYDHPFTPALPDDNSDRIMTDAD